MREVADGVATYRLVFSYTGIQEWLAKLIDHLLDYIEELVATHPSQPPPPLYKHSQHTRT